MGLSFLLISTPLVWVDSISGQPNDILRKVVVIRWNQKIRACCSWIHEGVASHPSGWLDPDFVLPPPFLTCRSIILDGSGVLLESAAIDEQFLAAWLSFFRRCGQRAASVHDFASAVVCLS